MGSLFSAVSISASQFSSSYLQKCINHSHRLSSFVLEYFKQRPDPPDASTLWDRVLRFGEGGSEILRTSGLGGTRDSYIEWVGKAGWQTLNIVAEQEFRGRVQGESWNGVLWIALTFIDWWLANRKPNEWKSFTWKSTACPVRNLSFICSITSSACRSKLSKSVIRSRLKNGRVIERWNLLKCAMSTRTIVYGCLTEHTSICHLYVSKRENTSILAERFQLTIWVENACAQDWSNHLPEFFTYTLPLVGRMSIKIET